MNPAEKRRLAHLDGDGQHLVERIEDRDLHQHGQAAHQRIDLLPLIQRHGLLLQLGLVLLELLFQLLDHGLDLLHLAHRLEALVGEREEDQPDHHGQRQDGHADRAQVVVEEFQEIERGMSVACGVTVDQ